MLSLVFGNIFKRLATAFTNPGVVKQIGRAIAAQPVKAAAIAIGTTAATGAAGYYGHRAYKNKVLMGVANDAHQKMIERAEEHARMATENGQTFKIG